MAMLNNQMVDGLTSRDAFDSILAESFEAFEASEFQGLIHRKGLSHVNDPNEVSYNLDVPMIKNQKKTLQHFSVTCGTPLIPLIPWVFHDVGASMPGKTQVSGSPWRGVEEAALHHMVIGEGLE